MQREMMVLRTPAAVRVLGPLRCVPCLPPAPCAPGPAAASGALHLAVLAAAHGALGPCAIAGGMGWQGASACFECVLACVQDKGF